MRSPRANLPPSAATARRSSSPWRRAGIRAQPARFGRASFVRVFDQLHEDQRQLRQSNDADRVAAGKEVDDVAKILVVVAGHNGNAIERGLKNVVSASRHQAATDECDGSQRIERSQLPDTIDQK